MIPARRFLMSNLVLAAMMSFAACGRQTETPSTTPEPSAAWESVWAAVQSPAPSPEPAGAPSVRDGRVWFHFRPEGEPARVFLAGDFNAWAQNDNGRVSNARFAMQRSPEGTWSLAIPHDRDTFAYKFVVETSDRRFDWLPDPAVATQDSEGHSLVTLPRIRPNAEPVETRAEALQSQAAASPVLRPQMERVWVRPGESNLLHVEPDRTPGTGARWQLTISDAAGAVVHEADFPVQRGLNRLPVPALNKQGGYRASVRLEEPGFPTGEGWTVLTVANSIADDLRYGFFATYANRSGDPARRAASLAGLLINAVEFYDYFPAHGRYAPTEPAYTFEPFGIKIDAMDVRDKVEACRTRNILPLAYVAAYAASESVYREFPFPMTDEAGSPLVFNGEIMTEERADREGKPKWFYLMNIAADSPWRAHVFEEFRRALDDKPGDLVSFDGFEIDTYGDRPEDRFHAPGSTQDGTLRREVLREFVGGVRDLTREIKPHGLVSFNSVNEFGVEGMYDSTDFLFMEIWKFHADRLSQLTEICRHHRAQRNQRVILKIYPADMENQATSFSPFALARLMGATLAGGGSLMVAGEPDPATGQPHALNSLFYPDHVPLEPASAEVLRAYNLHDALHFGLTHGRNVRNIDLAASLPDSLVTAFASPDHRTLTLQILHYGNEPKWTAEPGPIPPLENETLRFPLPGEAAPQQVLFSSPDSPATAVPAAIPFSVRDGTIEIPLPPIATLGTLSLRY